MAEPTWLLPGPHTCVVGDRLWMLVAGLDAVLNPSPSGAAQRSLEQLWSLVSARPSAEEVLDVLSGGMLRGLPDFAIVLAEDESMRVLVRGAVTARVGDRVVTAGDVSTWVETVVPTSDEITLAVSGDLGEARANSLDAVGLLAAGVVSAGGLIRTTSRADYSEPGVNAGAATTLESETTPSIEPTPTGPSPTMQPLDPEAEVESPPAAAVPTGEVEPASVVREPEEVRAADDDEFDALFGQTVMRTVEGAAVREAASPAETRSVAGPSADPVVTAATPTSAPDVPSRTGLIGAGGPLGAPAEPVIHQPPPARRPLIDGIPGAQASPAAPGAATMMQPQVPVQVDGEIEEQTVRRSQAAAESGRDASADAPLVQAVRCVSGHPNPPQEEACRVCGSVLGTGSVVSIPRPSLGRLVFDGGQSVPVTRPIVIGRAPKSPSDPRGEVPLLFTIDSPAGDVSRSHLEIVLEGWHVQAVDLDSANGTTVTQPGQPPRRLHAGEPVILQAGARIELSDEVAFVYEVRG